MSTGCKYAGIRCLSRCVPLLLPALMLCAWCIAFEICLYSRFKAVFGGFCGFRVGLCCLGALRGLCGFCTRVELGGLKTFCVFASVLSVLSVFVLLCPRVCSPLLVLFRVFPFLSALVSLWLLLLFPFPFRSYRAKKRGHKVLFLVSSLVLLWVVLV